QPLAHLLHPGLHYACTLFLCLSSPAANKRGNRFVGSMKGYSVSGYPGRTEFGIVTDFAQVTSNSMRKDNQKSFRITNLLSSSLKSRFTRANSSTLCAQSYPEGLK